MNKRMINVLHVTHSWGGGIKTYIDDLVKESEGRYNNFVLQSDKERLVIEYLDRGSHERSVYYLNKIMQLSDFYDQTYAEVFSLILKAYNIDIVHINSSVGHTFDIFKVSRELNVPIVFTVHDFFYICPTFHLVGKDGRFCGICPHGDERIHCLDNHPYLFSQFDEKMLRRWRDEFTSVIKYINMFIFPSQSTKYIFSNFFKICEEACRVVYHGTSFDRLEKAKKNLTSGLRVGILGSIFPHKGKNLITSVLRNINDDEIKFVHFGDGDLTGKNLIKYGRYARNDILHLIREYEIDVILILSVWPETFSYTLSESLAANVPPVVTNLGALKERVEHAGIGWVVDYRDSKNICDLLIDLKNNRNKIEECSKRIASLGHKTLEEMGSEYQEIYQSMLSEDKTKKATDYINPYYKRRLDKLFGQSDDYKLNDRINNNISDFIFRAKKKLNRLLYM